MLAHSLVTAKGASPERYALFLHGILGTRANWRGLARKVVEQRPEWGAILVDLREHGDSLGQAPPHTIAACASDVDALVGSLERPVFAALGHSFGGKVVLEWLRARDGIETAAWIIDSTPSRRSVVEEGSETAEVLRVLAQTLRELGSLEDAVVAFEEGQQAFEVLIDLGGNRDAARFSRSALVQGCGHLSDSRTRIS